METLSIKNKKATTKKQTNKRKTSKINKIKQKEKTLFVI